MASRLARAVFSKGRQVHSSLPARSAPSLRRWSTAAASSQPEDDIVVETFVRQQTDFRAYISELQKIEIPMDPCDAKAVKDYAEEQKRIRAKLGIPSQTERLADLIESAFEESDSLRSYLTTVSKLRTEMDLVDPDTDAVMLKALEAVEAKLGKEVSTGDEKAMEAWAQAVSATGGERLAAWENEDVEKLEDEVEFDAVKAEVEDYKKTAEETLKTFKRRDGLDSINVSLKDLDPRPYL